MSEEEAVTTRSVQISEELYERLSEQAAQLQLAPEQFIERRLSGGLAPFDAEDEAPEVAIPPAGSEEALAAVHRLTTLFADVVIPDLDHALDDPLIALANADAALVPHDS
jgi:hypothetical protein